MILFGSDDPMLTAELANIGATTGHEIVSDVARYFDRAEAVIVDADGAAEIGELAAFRPRRGIFLVAPDPGPPDEAALRSAHAERGFTLPAQAPELLATLGRIDRGRVRLASPAGGRPATLGVVGSCGGAGASTLAVALALGMSEEQRVVLVDVGADPGGADLLLGLEDSPGARWQDLRLSSGGLTHEQLLAGLPGVGAVSVLAAARSLVETTDPSPAGIEEALTALRDVACVCDIPRSLVGVEAMDACILLVPAEVRAAAAAAQIAARLRARRVRTVGVLRHRYWSGVSRGDLANLIRVDVVAEIPTIPGLARSAETTGLRAVPRRMRAPIRRLLEEVS